MPIKNKSGEQVFSLTECARMTGIPISTWSQGVSMNRISSELLATEDSRKKMPRHFVTLDEMCRFEELCKNGIRPPAFVIANGKTTINSSDEDLTHHTMMERVELAREARELGMTLDEYINTVCA